MANKIIMWGPTDRGLRTLKPGGFNDERVKTLLKRIYEDLRDHGAQAIRVPGVGDYEVVSKLLDEVGGIGRAVIGAYGSAWQQCDDAGQPLPFGEKVATWLNWNARMFQTWDPDYVLPDVEHNNNPDFFQIEKCPDLPWRLQALVKKYCRAGTPTGWFGGDINIGPGGGDWACPQFYRLWQYAVEQKRSPAEVAREMVTWPGYCVLGGHVWISFQYDPFQKKRPDLWIFDDDSPVTTDDALEAIGVLAELAEGCCLYASPYSWNMPLGDPRQERALEMMGHVNALWG